MGSAYLSLIGADPISIHHILEISDCPSIQTVRPDIYRVNLELRLVRPTIDMLETEPDLTPALDRICLSEHDRVREISVGLESADCTNPNPALN